jgi:hypothetical protein
MQGRVGTCLEDDVAFGVKDESAHIGDDCAATVDDAGHRLDAHVPVVHGDVVTATRCRTLRRESMVVGPVNVSRTKAEP